MRLYEAKWRIPCRDSLRIIGVRVTSLDGNFDFGDVTSGRYWLVVELQHRSLSLPLDVDSKQDWEASCDTQGPYVEKNFISWMSGMGVL